ncbi:MAG: hypothetical protein AAFR58_11310 [Cyanobacteria bacterium J06627_28]
MSAVLFLGFIAKAACLIWAFVRTQKVAALVYIAFLVVSAIVPAIAARLLGGAAFALFNIYYNAGASLIEVGLFIWLVRSLLKRRAVNTEALASDSTPGSSQDWL